MSRRERERSTPEFAEYLVGRSLELFGQTVLAALWVQTDTWYRNIEGIEVWSASQDARTYKGPWPIVAHPPCGPWGKLAWSSKQSKLDGQLAMQFVHTYGGVVEQPLGSSLFREHGQGGFVEKLWQFDYFHRGLKPTILYWYKP